MPCAPQTIEMDLAATHQIELSLIRMQDNETAGEYMNRVENIFF